MLQQVREDNSQAEEMTVVAVVIVIAEAVAVEVIQEVAQEAVQTTILVAAHALRENQARTKSSL